MWKSLAATASGRTPVPRTDTLPFSLLSFLYRNKGEAGHAIFRAEAMRLCKTQDHVAVTFGRMIKRGLVVRRIYLVDRTAVNDVQPALAAGFPSSGWLEWSDYLGVMDSVMQGCSPWVKTKSSTLLFKSGALERRVSLTAAGVREYVLGNGST